MDMIDKRLIVLTWVMRGIEDFFVAFSKFDDSFSRYRAFFNAMGFEMITKAYLLALRSPEYEVLQKDEAIRRVDKITKEMSHDVKRLVDKIKKPLGEQKLQKLLEQQFDGFSGSQFIEVIEAAYSESRYPAIDPIHKRFPSGIKGVFWEPLFSSGLDKFCYAFSREIITSLRSDFKITITTSILSERVFGEPGLRFCNLFFAGRMSDFISNHTRMGSEYNFLDFHLSLP